MENVLVIKSYHLNKAISNDKYNAEKAKKKKKILMQKEKINLKGEVRSHVTAHKYLCAPVIQVTYPSE